MQDWFAFLGNDSQVNFTITGEEFFPNNEQPSAENNFGFCQVCVNHSDYTHIQPSLHEPARECNIFWLLKIRKFTIKQSGFDDNSVINSRLVSNKCNSNLNYRSYESLLFIAPLAEKLSKEDITLDSRFHFATFFSLSYSSPMVIRTKPWQTNRWALFSPRLQTTSALIFLRTPVALSGQCGKKKIRKAFFSLSLSSNNY